MHEPVSSQETCKALKKQGITLSDRFFDGLGRYRLWLSASIAFNFKKHQKTDCVLIANTHRSLAKRREALQYVLRAKKVVYMVFFRYLCLRLDSAKVRFGRRPEKTA